MSGSFICAMFSGLNGAFAVFNLINGSVKVGVFNVGVCIFCGLTAILIEVMDR